MKGKLSGSTGILERRVLIHFLLTTCGFFTGFTVNSIIAIFLLSHDAFAIQPPKKPETSTVQKKQSIETSRPRNSQSSSLGGVIKLDCSTRINLLQPLDCPVGGGDEVILNIPKEPILRNPNHHDFVPENDESKIPLFEIRF